MSSEEVENLGAHGGLCCPFWCRPQGGPEGSKTLAPPVKKVVGVAQFGPQWGMTPLSGAPTLSAM